MMCGKPPQFPYSRRVDGRHIEKELVYPEQAVYLCDEGYFAEGFKFPTLLDTSTTTRAPGEYPLSRLIQLQCDTNATFVHDPSIDLVCVPKCGDGRLMPTDHLWMYDPREQCDDGNPFDGDGCSGSCRVEPGYICAGGTKESPDTCKPSKIQADSSLVLSISGQRQVTHEEVANASAIAIGLALACPGGARDIVIKEVVLSNMKNSTVETSGGDGRLLTTDSKFHTYRYSAGVAFSALVSDPEMLSIDKINGELKHPTGLQPRLWLAYTDHTSLVDLYVRVVQVESPSLVGDVAEGRPVRWSLSAFVKEWTLVLSPIVSYIILITCVAPGLVWFWKVRPRRYKLYGRFDDVPPEFKGNWAFNICTCIEHRMMCFSLIICLPARLAETWDTAGLVSYWAGVRRAVLCCFLYLIPGCQPCGAALAGRMRSNLRDFFGFGDDQQGNLEFGDCCCYLICPICCVVQEAKHIDAALQALPPPLEGGKNDWMFDLGHAANDGSIIAAPGMTTMPGHDEHQGA